MLREMKKAILTAIIVAILSVSLFASIEAVEMAKANWVYMPQSPNTDPPTIIFLSPINNSTYVDNVNLNFTVTKPDSWIPSGDKPYGSIRSIAYTIDGQEHILYTAHDQIPFDDLEPNTNFNLTFKEILSDGPHSLKVNVEAATIYWKWSTPVNGVSALLIQEYPMSASDSVSFSLVTLPKILNLSIENKTYNATPILLNFTVDEPTLWIGYSLDHQENITLQGNNTLTSIADGSHSIVVYANDTTGNEGKSNTVFFTVNTHPSPSPSPTQNISPSNSPTHQPTLEPSPTSHTYHGEDFTPTIIIYGLIAIVAVISLLAYFAKRKGCK